MWLQEQLMEDYKQAMRDKAAIKKEILNFIISQVKYKKIEIQKDPTDEDVIQIIKKEIKSRQESISFLEKAWNTEEITLENQRIEIMNAYLPAMMPREQLETIVKDIISSLNIDDPKKNRWAVIGAVMKDHKAVVDGAILNDIINNL